MINIPSYKAIIQSYTDEQSALALARFLCTNEIKFKVVRDRESKLGDFKAKSRLNRFHTITVNKGLNKYSFLVTLIHEIAHYTAHIKYGNHIKPHGSQWKSEFKRHMKAFMNERFFPLTVLRALVNYMDNPAASSCSDPNLYRTLKQFDINPPRFVEELPINSTFTLHNGKTFKKGKRLRKRFECIEIESGRKYLVNPLAEVNEL